MYLTNDELKELVLEDFKDITTDIEDKFNLYIEQGNEMGTIIHYGFFDGPELVGYSTIVYNESVIQMGFSKAYNYNGVKQIYLQLKQTRKDFPNLPILTDGTNWNHCKNNVIPSGKFKGYYEWIV